MVGEREGGLMLQEEKNSIWIDSDREQNIKQDAKLSLFHSSGAWTTEGCTVITDTGEQSAFVTSGGNIFK